MGSEDKIEEPFYFKSYDRIIGVARNLNELQTELARLALENLTALEYHLSAGHIVEWLEHSNEKGLAAELKGAGSLGEAQIIISDYLETKSKAALSKPSRRGRPKRRADSIQNFSP